MENKMFVSKNDRSKWPARSEFDRSSLRSGRTLSVDRPLFSALITTPELKYQQQLFPERKSDIKSTSAQPSGRHPMLSNSSKDANMKVRKTFNNQKRKRILPITSRKTYLMLVLKDRAISERSSESTVLKEPKNREMAQH